MQCPFCNNTQFVPINDVQVFRYMPTTLPLGSDKVRVLVEACTECGLGVNMSPLSAEELDEIYSNYFYISPFQAIGHSSYKATLDLIKKYTKKDDSMLEIGCSEGYLLHLLRDEGYTNLIGVEPSNYADKGISLGLNIHKGYYNADFPLEKPVDMFALRHVFEHFEKPFEIFEAMVKHLSDDGKIYIETPDFDCYVPQHLYFFSWPFYEQLAERYNLKIVHSASDGANIAVVFAKASSPIPALHCECSVEQLRKDALAKIDSRKKRFQEKLALINECVSSHKKVYWWGTRALALPFLDAMIDSDCEITPIDSQPMRKGYILPKVAKPVVTPADVRNTSAEVMIVATSFIDEIKKTMKEYNILVDSFLHIG